MVLVIAWVAVIFEINTMSQNIALKFHFQWYLSQNFTVIVNTMCGVTPNG